MDFTREPIIETIITPRDGHKLVVKAIRSDLNQGQDEYLVDALEMVSFGQALFFRSLERPKAFLLPVSHYEVTEVREARMVLKHVLPERSLKNISMKNSGNAGKESRIEERATSVQTSPALAKDFEEETETQASPSLLEENTPTSDSRAEKRKERRRASRRRRGRDTESTETLPIETQEQIAILSDQPTLTTPSLSLLLTPPDTLISQTIEEYRRNELFKGAFFLSKEDEYQPHDKLSELLADEDEENHNSYSAQSHAFEELKASEEATSDIAPELSHSEPALISSEDLPPPPPPFLPIEEENETRS